MAIVMRLLDGKRTGPVVVCDHCGEVIERAADGNAEWTYDDPSIYFTHKKCCFPFEGVNGGRARWLAIELSHFQVYLMNNTLLDLDRARSSVAALDSIL